MVVRQQEDAEVFLHSWTFNAINSHVFFLECGLVLFSYCLYDALIKKKYIAEVAILLLYCLSGIISIFLLGGFGGTRSFWGGAGGFGEYSFNLNGLLILKEILYYIMVLPMAKNSMKGFHIWDWE